MPRIGPLGIWELLIILVVILLIFGPRRLPEMAKGIGQSVREFRKGIRDMKDDFESATNEQPAKAQTSESRAAAPASDSKPAQQTEEATVATTVTESTPADKAV